MAAARLSTLLFLLSLVFPVVWSERDDYFSVLCVPTTMAVMEETEGRHSCAYDSSLGYRAVGVGYNLDDKSPERQREIAAVFSDYDKVYRGETCLNDIQINTLLTMDARRGLLKSGDEIPTFENWCCGVQAVFADISFTRRFEGFSKELAGIVDLAIKRQWEAAAEDLQGTKWCKRSKGACGTISRRLQHGCSSASIWGAASSRVAPLRSAVCVPRVMAVMEHLEGVHRCAYDSKLGFRAVGVGYNLDDKSEERRRELSAIFLDHDKVYQGETCLSDIQVTTLEALDARRALRRAETSIAELDSWCCDAQAAFAFIALGTKPEEGMPKDLERVAAAAKRGDWEAAASGLKDTHWCGAHKEACPSLQRQLAKGCPESLAAYLSTFIM